jgi:hypothetical protein
LNWPVAAIEKTMAGAYHALVMAGLDPAIHVFLRKFWVIKTWMPGTRPGMTKT